MSGNSNGNRVSENVASKLKPALVALQESLDYAEDTASDRWGFAVSIRQFRKLGLNDTDLRWLVQKGYVEHAREITSLDEDGREFVPTGNLSFCKRTCFVLTSAGSNYAYTLATQNGIVTASVEASGKRVSRQAGGEDSLPSSGECPIWDSERRELRLNGDIVKQFKWSAANQEMILAAFEEENWPPHIDDPLPPQVDQDSKRRLSDTIKCLNRKQKCGLIHFRGDGTGEGVIWERGERDAHPNGSS